MLDSGSHMASGHIADLRLRLDGLDGLDGRKLVAAAVVEADEADTVAGFDC